MSSPTSSFLGYGYTIDLYSDSPYDYYDQSELFEEWKAQVIESKYYHFSSYYTEEYCFFGVQLSDTADAGEIVNLEKDSQWNEANEWNECETEFHKFFPNLNNKPHLYLVSIYWG